MSTSKTYTESDVRANLAKEPKWAERAILRLYERQTATEQNVDQTINRNYQGFQPCDAYMFTQFAKWLLKGRSLSPKQLAYCGVWTAQGAALNLRVRTWRGKPVLCKYAGQLLTIMEEDAAKRTGVVTGALDLAASSPLVKAVTA